mmetsp:Transcript_43323/g.144302  ORF Transcript_43323/g.144302 Transcript_43323/m.144302 type:complete len:267 (-) Transcript_43323:482-1282(-)
MALRVPQNGTASPRRRQLVRRGASHRALARASASSCSWKMAEVMLPADSVGSFFATEAWAGPRAATSARSLAMAAFIASRSAFCFATRSAASRFRASSSARRRSSCAWATARVSAATAAACAAACAAGSSLGGSSRNSRSTMRQPCATRNCRDPGTCTSPSATSLLERRIRRYFGSAGAFETFAIIFAIRSSAGRTRVSLSAASLAVASSTLSASSSYVLPPPAAAAAAAAAATATAAATHLGRRHTAVLVARRPRLVALRVERLL